MLLKKEQICLVSSCLYCHLESPRSFSRPGCRFVVYAAGVVHVAVVSVSVSFLGRLLSLHSLLTSSWSLSSLGGKIAVARFCGWPGGAVVVVVIY